MTRKLTKLAIVMLLLTVMAAALAVTMGGTVFAEQAETVYLGGTPIGISAKSDELIVSEIINVTTSEGSYSPAYQSGIVKGDIIAMVNNVRVTDINTFNEAIQSADNEVVITVRRQNTLTDIIVKPAFDLAQNSKKIGLLLKNEIAGIGTLTFVTKNNRYGALGHLITDSFGYGEIYTGGNIYDCTVTGFNPASEDAPGELRGSIDYNKVAGTINKNIFCGIFGYSDLTTENLHEINLGRREEVVNGKAQILTTIDGKEPKLYDIEIIKAVKQTQPADKSMVIRITDKELKKTTGGILQGMSGSPIIQKGKLIGAVTHVFTSDSTKGYGIYVDWMLPNA